MKSTLTTLLSLAAIGMSLTAQGQYTKNNVRLLSQIPLNGFPGSPSNGSGCAGYTSASGKEYAIMGLSNGNAVVNITNPALPVIVGHIPGVNSLWHEVCVLGDYAYACTEGGGGIQIIDLRQVDLGIVTLAATYTGNGVSTGHTIQAIPESKLVIINGGNPSPPGGLRALDCQNPTAPVEVGTWTTKYVHDALYRTYTEGPYAGKTICFAFCGNGSAGGMYIIDVTTTTNAQGLRIPAMQQMGFIKYYPNNNNFYSHSGSLSADGKYIFANDELDEVNGLTPSSTTFVIDVQNLAAPTYVTKFVNPINAIDHNSMIQDGFLFLSAYKSGMRVYDTQNPLQIKETGFFDTFPEGSGLQFAGDWGAWANFPSGTVILSDMNRGLFIVDASEAKGWGAPITSVAGVNITLPADAVKKLRKPDSISVVFDGNKKGEISVSLATESLSKDKVDFSFRARSRSGRQEKVELFGINQATGKAQLLGAFALGAEYAEFKVVNQPGGNYIKADNSLKMRLELRPGRQGDALVDVDTIKAFVHN
jgi:choice-of-anchor B domain-containing protein